MKKKGTDKSLLAKPFSYRDLVQYQEGSIVSRTVIDQEVGTVTVFAFDEGQSLSEHTAPFDALIEVVEGAGVITIEGTEHGVKAGEQIIMPADKPHAVIASERFKMVLVMIRAKPL
ncbi:cupin domain-containing protein [Chitinispirillales bacterium ANBcel5]|uniref:cupin domain-containing protein n=1 Tax=Cellulosispirillum alkaliphilum TaxID=3039283 RepID=UPI002A50CAA7|nr:cupin domain-containing protein [Chitinispirillales bacterium ANBcel5]